ncbi:N-6 DNA methylase [Leisingera sp. F5]|uniref:N-6 DNA methylase n=1 Tax=Leisingera sp. F5 TaxID=1813816 RepID=UPI000A474337|nr:N-6 DNA methylase [Leisingera sp. F5]
MVEAIIALPQEIFFRTGIGTYTWILSNKKPEHRQGKVQLINATEMFEPLRKSEGNKRRRVSEQDTRDIVCLYSEYGSSDDRKKSKVFDYQSSGYRRVRVPRPPPAQEDGHFAGGLHQARRREGLAEEL